EPERGVDQGVGPSFTALPARDAGVFDRQTGVALECRADGSPTPALSWVTADGRPVTSVPGIRVVDRGQIRYFSFTSDMYNPDYHRTELRCMASNSAGAIISLPVRIWAVLSRPYELLVRDSFASAGGPALLTCDLPSYVTSHVTVASWVRDDEFNIYPSDDTDGRYVMLPSGELLLRAPEADQGHTFRCRVVNTVTGQTRLSSNAAKVVIRDRPPPDAPQVAVLRREEAVREGDTLVVPCVVSSQPPADVRWMKVSEDGLSVTAVQHGPVLTLKPAQRRDSGAYLCRAANVHGPSEVKVTVKVISPLHVTLTPNHATVDVGAEAKLTCSVHGGPHGPVTWLKDTRPLTSDLSADGSVWRVERLRPEHAGVYQCLVGNGADGTLREEAQAVAAISVGNTPPVLTSSFMKQTTDSGRPTSLSCSARGSPTPQITWFLDGRPLPDNPRYVPGQTVHRGDVLSHLNMSRVTPAEGGLYECAASNAAGTVRHAARLNVYGAPVVRSTGPVSAAAGSQLTLRCPVGGYPIKNITWSHEGRARLPSHLRLTADFGLVFDHVTRADAGIYSCTAWGDAGASDSGTTRLSVVVGPKVSPFTFTTGLRAGDRESVKCVVTRGDSPLTLTWVKDGEPLSEPNVTAVNEFTSILSFSSLRREHSGNYTCAAKNGAGEASYSALLTVSVAPFWVFEPEDVDLVRGQGAEVKCWADGYPPPAVTWSRPGADGVGTDLPQRNGTLLLTDINGTHSGAYMCQAVNGVSPRLMKTIQIRVRVPPQVKVTPASVRVVQGQPVEVRCDVIGDRPMAVTWMRAGRDLALASDHRLAVLEESSGEMSTKLLRFSETLISDSGQYICAAENDFGRAHLYAFLTVKEAPVRPTHINLETVGSRSLSLTWGPDPTTELKFIIQYRPATINGTWLESAVERGTRTTLTGLRPWVTYQLRVLSLNDVGRSQPSPTIEIQTDEDLPEGAVRLVQLTALTPTCLRVTWAPVDPQLANGYILGYNVTYSRVRAGDGDRDARSMKVFDGGSDRALISGLERFTAYMVTVTAYNSRGPGPASEPVSAKTAEDAPDRPPAEVSCAAASTDTLTVTWTPPEVNHRHGILRGYTVSYVSSSNWMAVSLPLEVRRTRATLRHLVPHTAYQVRVQSHTSAGAGPWSEPILCWTSEDVPGPPRKILAVMEHPGAMVISWLPPEPPRGRLLAYTLYLRHVASNETSSHRVPPTQTWFGGVPADRYEVWVRAESGRGPGRPGQVLQTAPTAAVPAAVWSFGAQLVARWRQPLTLHCRHHGQPAPQLSWLRNGRPLTASDRLRWTENGTLEISSVSQEDDGVYTCDVTNRHGRDNVTYDVIVISPPTPPVPLIHDVTNTSLRVSWTPGPPGRLPLTAFRVLYAPAGAGAGAAEEWSVHEVSAGVTELKLTRLVCGTLYKLTVEATSRLGSSGPGLVLERATRGYLSPLPPPDRVITANQTAVRLNFDPWHGECAVEGFTVTFGPVGHGRPVGPIHTSAARMTLTQLRPDTGYQLVVTSVGLGWNRTATYRLRTLPRAGQPSHGSPGHLEVSGTSGGGGGGSGGGGGVLQPYVRPLLAAVLSAVSCLLLVTAGCLCYRRHPGQFRARCGSGSSDGGGQRQVYDFIYKANPTSSGALQAPAAVPVPQDMRPYSGYMVTGVPEPRAADGTEYRSRAPLHHTETLQMDRVYQCRRYGGPPSPSSPTLDDEASPGDVDTDSSPRPERWRRHGGPSGARSPPHTRRRRRRHRRSAAAARASFHEAELPELEWPGSGPAGRPPPPPNASLPRLLPAGVQPRDEEQHYRACTLNGIKRNFTIAV
ncbi:Down syndrome cell adhesion molecule-like protein Dscam2, partial [Amphibalanus amphitrite]|uniref:Down syndrome cell adhesion molecule-like protein Dscam2 n=1 Tax=Amphibalanus amphitrite TaxID=1232801 RepID=UPI001C91D2C1